MADATVEEFKDDPLRTGHTSCLVITSLRLIAAFGYTIPNCGVLFLFLGLPVFCFCFVRVFWLLFFFVSWSLFSISCHGMVPSIHAQRTK